MEITKQSLEQSLKEKNDVVSQLTSKTQELQEVSNKLLVKVKSSSLIIYIVSLLIYLYSSSERRKICDFLCINNYKQPFYTWQVPRGVFGLFMSLQVSVF